MKIQELRIRNFGKLADKELGLSDGINLIYGENESGKSTVHTFIKSMLFGMERGRGRAAASDTYSSYEPWDTPNYYSGKMKFISGGKSFWIDRNFDKYSKKAELFCEEDGEELSIEDGDLSVLLGEISEGVYDNTISIGQLKVQPGQPLSAELKNYATNYYASGNGELDLNAALARLKERRREIDRQIREEFKEKQVKRERIEQEASFIWRDVHRLEGENESLKEKIAYRMEHEEPEEPENKRMIDELRPGNWRVHPIEIAVFAIVIILVCYFIHRPWNYLVAIVITLLCFIYTWNRMKISKKQEKTEPELLLEEITPEEEKVPLERLWWELDHIQEELKEKQTEYNNLREQLEEMDEMSESFWEMERQREAVDLAADKIDELSARLQKQMVEKMNERVSHMIEELTGGRYSRLTIGDNLQMTILHEGRRIPIERLSRGTMEQIYLALRLTAAEILYSEELPIILDDTFGYYDDMRLENVLGWLARSKKQVLIFTCQNREEEVLKNIGAAYTKCEL